jgi:hypothetical protein
MAMKKPRQVITAIVIGMLVAILLVYFGLTYRMYSINKEKIDNAIKIASRFVQVEYGSISANIFTNRITINNITLTSSKFKPITIDSLSYKIHATDQNFLASYLSLQLKGASFDVSKANINANTAMMIDLLKLKKIITDMDLDFRYIAAKKTILLKFSQTLVGHCKIQFALIANHFDATSLMQNYSSEIKSMRFEYTDQSLVPAIISIVSKKMNITKEQFIAGVEMRINNDILKSQDPKHQQMLKQIVEFIKKPGTLTIDATPETPISLAELQLLSPEKAADRLNLIITSN